MIEIARVESCSTCESFKNVCCTMPEEVYGEKPVKATPDGMCEMYTPKILKIQRKLLTNEQKRAICKAKGYHCSKCPLELTFDDSSYCYSEVKDLEDAVQNYWNEEIEIEVECL